MKVESWGDDLAVRLPEYLIESLQLKEGDEVRITVERLEERRALTAEERQRAIEKIRSLRFSLPEDYMFNRDEIYDN